MTETPRLPTFFIPHGGGPCFFIRPEDMPPGMPKDAWHPLETHLRGISAQVGRRPEAVLVITAHWLCGRPTIGSAARHRLLYDYYNFPDYTYRFDYAPPGSPSVAAQAAAALSRAGIAADLDSERGIDHGVFVPFMLIYPDGDVPIVPMSLQQDLSAAAHLAIGHALAPLRDKNVLIVGSGMSFHNMRAIMNGGQNAEALAFDTWLNSAAGAPPEQRDAALGAWDRAPGARVAHPPGGEEHLIPLMVAAGAGSGAIGRRDFSGELGGKRLSGFTFR